MDVLMDLQARGFVYAGAIRSIDSGKRCKADVRREIQGWGLTAYALVVGGQMKKCGDTGRKDSTLKKRMDDCARAMNMVLCGALAGPFTEHFKERAPEAIKKNEEISIWARPSTAGECKSLQRELNREYDTIRIGWANRLE